MLTFYKSATKNDAYNMFRENPGHVDYIGQLYKYADNRKHYGFDPHGNWVSMEELAQIIEKEKELLGET
jgi:hypothetical protein